jgi:hypothetical protein
LFVDSQRGSGLIAGFQRTAFFREDRRHGDATGGMSCYLLAVMNIQTVVFQDVVLCALIERYYYFGGKFHEGGNRNFL